VEAPKYAIFEIERRWHVRPDVLERLGELFFTMVTDLYISQTRMRLRCMEKPSGEKTYKLCKKYGKTNSISEPIVNIYLNKSEYELMKDFCGAEITKKRYKIAGGSLDIFSEETKIPPVFEVEFASEDAARAYTPPEFVTEEITDDPALTGLALARGRG
jgi:CYTH domain-containing protein